MEFVRGGALPLLFFTKFEPMKGFVKVSHDIITETSISVGARLVLIYLNSKPEDWQFFMQDIAGQLGLSYKMTQKYVKELEKAGFLLRERKQKNGVFYYSWKASNSTATRVTVTHFTANGDTANGGTANGDTANDKTVNDDTANGGMGSILRIEESKNNITKNKLTKNKKRAHSRILKNSGDFVVPVDEMADLFQVHQIVHFGRRLEFDGKEWKNLERIGDKLANLIERDGGEITQEILINKFDEFLERSGNCSGGWYRDKHFTPSGLNSQFTKIINTKDDGTKKGHEYSDSGLIKAAFRIGSRYDGNHS